MSSKAAKKELNKPPRWTYCFQTKKYEINETRNGIIYKNTLDESQWLCMMNACNDSFDREQWLIKNNKQPKPTKNVSKTKRLV